MQIEDGVSMPRDAGGVCLAVKHAEGAAISLRGLDLEVPRGESKQIGRQRSGLGEAHHTPFRGMLFGGTAVHFFPVRYRLPTGRKIQLQGIAAFEIWLIKTRKRQARARRHEERVQEIVVAIER